MPGVLIFDPDDENIGLSVGDDQAVAVHQDLEDDALYISDLNNIIQWEGDAVSNMQYTWRSGKVRLPRRVNLGAAIVEAESYNSLTFRLYAEINGTYTLIASRAVADDEPFRLPGGYLSNVYGVEIIGTDRVSSFAVAQNILELAGE